MLIRIYKIVNDINNEIYIGSTTSKLNIRFIEHKCHSKRNPMQNNFYTIAVKYGWEHFKILLIDEIEVINKKQQLQKEQEYMNILNPSLNNLNAAAMLCVHRKKKQYCRDCKGSIFCIHDKRKQHCRECNGSIFCIHDKDKRICKECNGVYCEYCDKTYSGKGNFYRHILQAHFKYMCGVFN